MEQFINICNVIVHGHELISLGVVFVVEIEVEVVSGIVIGIG